jgi:uncharacterized protein
LITGASSGIGYAMALELGTMAKKIVLVARRNDQLRDLKNQLLRINPKLEILALPCDLTNLQETDKMLSLAGPIDILINNAGMGDMGLFASSEWPKLQQMLTLNVISLTYLTSKLLPHMLQQKKGGILMVGSTAGLQTIPAFGTYSGTKFYVNGFTEALRSEVRHHGVVVTQLCPGPVATEFEQVAKRNDDFKLPKFLEISAQQCAHEALQGFAAGRAVVIPGKLTKTMMFAQKLLPLWLARFTMEWMARRMKSYG